MKCLYPVRYYRDDKGMVHHNPNKVKVKSDGFRPCQYCINCRLRRAQSNALRMVHEAKFHNSNSFLTLTYDDSNLPPGGSLQYDDVTKFVKKLRRRLHSSVSYYRVGEYGSNFSRPHYHMVLFGYDFSEPVKYHGVLNQKSVSGQKDDRTYYKSTFANDLWSKGFVDIGDVDFSTCMYVAKYVTKKLYGTEANLYGSLESERASSSKLNPIGKRWIEKYYSDVYPHDYIVHDGKKFQPPRYYDEWLKTEKPSLYELVKKQREDSASDNLDWYDLHAAHVIRVQNQNKFLRDGCAPNLTTDNELIKRKFDNLLEISKGNL